MIVELHYISSNTKSILVYMHFRILMQIKLTVTTHGNISKCYFKNRIEIIYVS